MMNYPETLEEARAHRYGTWAGNERGYKYVEGHCAYEVMRGYLFFQCKRKTNPWEEGLGALYCKTHLAMVKPRTTTLKPSQDPNAAAENR